MKPDRTTLEAVRLYQLIVEIVASGGVLDDEPLNLALSWIEDEAESELTPDRNALLDIVQVVRRTAKEWDSNDK